MTVDTEERNRALVLQAFDTLFNKRDYKGAEQFWSANYIQHSAHIPPGRDGLFNLIRSVPSTLRITLDGHLQSHLALRLLRREDPKWKNVEVRSSQYLNNLIEQDHRAIKRRCAAMGGFKSFESAAITLAGIELAHRIRKRQFSFGRGRYQNIGSLKQIWDRALA
jgi:hypothetical protein